MRAMLSARGIFGVFRIFVTRTAEVTSLSVDIYYNPFLGVQVRLTRPHFLELQSFCNSKKLYCDMQCLHRPPVLNGSFTMFCSELLSAFLVGEYDIVPSLVDHVLSFCLIFVKVFQHLKHVICLKNKCLLLTEFEGRTVSYGLSFFRSDLWPKPQACGP